MREPRARVQLSHRWWGPARLCVVALVAATLASCGGGADTESRATVPMGTVTGMAYPCVGVSIGSRIAVRVTLLHGAHVVAAETVQYPRRYRLRARPGSYVVESSAQTSRTHSIVLRGHEIVEVDLPTYCK